LSEGGDKGGIFEDVEGVDRIFENVKGIDRIIEDVERVSKIFWVVVRGYESSGIKLE
ncbi:10007_t:CDS:1, partial [Dentiscutata heterogama]